MSGSENSNSSSPRYCPTPHQMPVPTGSPHQMPVPTGSPHQMPVPTGSPHQMPVPTGSPPPNAMMHQVIPGHGHGHGHHMQSQHSQSMGYYGYHNTGSHQQNYYAPQSPNANYYGMQQHPHPSHSPAPQYVQQQQATQWQTHVHQQGYYNHGYPPQSQQQQNSYAPQHSPHHQQQQQQQQQQIPVTVAGGNATYEIGLSHNLGPPSNHSVAQSHQHVVSNSESSGQNALMNLSRFVTHNQQQQPNPSHGSSSTSTTTPVPVNNTASSSISNVSSLSSNSNGSSSSPRPEPIRSPVAFPPNPAINSISAPLPGASTTNGGQTGMMPVRLQNMAKGARTKASMRKMMLEQQTSASSSVENHESNLEEPPKKRMRRKPRAKDAAESPTDDVSPLPEEPIPKKPRKPRTPKNKVEVSNSEPLVTPVPSPVKKPTLQSLRRSSSKSPAHAPIPIPVSTRVYSPDVTEMREKGKSVKAIPAPKKRGRKPKSQTPEKFEPKSSNNVEEEIAHVLLDLQTGKSSPEKSKEDASTSNLIERDSDSIVEDSVINKRKRKSSIKPIEINVSQVESKEKESISIKGKSKKVPKSKKVVKLEKVRKTPVRRKNSRKSLASANDDSASSVDLTPRKRRNRNSSKSETLPSSAHVESNPEPFALSLPSETNDMAQNNVNDFGEQEFPVIHIPETTSETSILVKAKIELPRPKETAAKSKSSTGSKSNVDLLSKSKSDSFSKSDSPSKTKLDSLSKAKSDAPSKSKSDPPSKAKLDAASKSKPDSPSKAKSDVLSRAKSDSPSKSKPDSSYKSKLDSSYKIKPDSSSKTKSDSLSKAKPDSPSKTKSEPPSKLKSSASLSIADDSPTISVNNHSKAVADLFPKSADYLIKPASELSIEPEIILENIVDACNVETQVKSLEEPPAKCTLKVESPPNTKVQSVSKQKTETPPKVKEGTSPKSKPETSSKLKGDAHLKQNTDSVETPKVETTLKSKSRPSVKDKAVNNSKALSPSKPKMESLPRVKKERKKTIKKNEAREKAPKTTSSKMSRKSSVGEHIQNTETRPDGMESKSELDSTLDFPVLSIPEDLSPATVSIPTKQASKASLSKPKRPYNSKKNAVAKTAAIPSKKGGRASKRKEMETSKDSSISNGEPTIILDNVEVQDFPVMSIAENDSTITITAATVINTGIPETVTKKTRRSSPKATRTPRQQASVKEEVNSPPAVVASKKSRTGKKRLSTGSTHADPTDGTNTGSLDAEEPVVSVLPVVPVETSTSGGEIGGHIVSKKTTPKKSSAGLKSPKSSEPAKKRQSKNLRLSNSVEIPVPLEVKATSNSKTETPESEGTKVVQPSRRRLSRSPSVTIVEPESPQRSTKKRETSTDITPMAPSSSRKRKHSKTLNRNAIDDVIESVVKEEANTPVKVKSSATLPAKKRVSIADRARLDIKENETIIEVSKAFDKPLPPLEFFYQFEYSQRNNYPPSLPSPAKRKHAVLEARKHDIMNELYMLNGPEALETEAIQNSPKSETLPDIEVPETEPVPLPEPEPKPQPEPSPTIPLPEEKIEEPKSVAQASSSRQYLDFIPALAKPLKKPSVFVKSMPLASANAQSKTEQKVNGLEVGSTAKTQDKKKIKKDTKAAQENKGKQEKRTSHIGPSLRVKGGVVKFYRGSDEEDVDVPVTKLRAERPTETYDSSVPWICAFCRLGPHTQRLGDLFGPYYTNTSAESLEEITPGVTSNTKTVMDGYKRGAQLLQKKETWMHQDCALWAGGVVLVGTSIRGLDKAVYDANTVTCTICKEKGAMIGCLWRGCDRAAHFPCAQRSNWNLDDDTFHSYCEIHSKF